MASSSLPLSLPSPLRFRSRNTRPPSFICSPLFLSLPTSVICFSTQNPSGYDREEVRWLREEQRWIREEQRWVREEQRWIREREALLREISDLQLKIEALESRNSQLGTSVPDTISNIAALLQVLKEKNRISENGLNTTPMILENTREPVEEGEEEEEKEVDEKLVIVEEKVRVSEPIKKKRRTLKVGSEGDEVKAMQEALLKLGFYSGEEDMEFSSFSSGTSSAVKSWQASLGVREDGIMTAELLQRLFMDEDIDTDMDGASTMKPEEAHNGAVFPSVTQVSEKQQSNIKEDQSYSEVDVFQNRVFLLGENRWEDPSRLIGRNKPVDRSKSTDSKTKCITCRGEGRLMCLECDGTGEPNIEPQFMEWVSEDMKCPYCEGLGYTVCDVCQGE